MSMEKPETSQTPVLKNMSGYNLPPDALSEIRALIMKRFQTPFSEGLSAEGRLAMQQVVNDNVTSAPPETKREISFSNQTKTSSTACTHRQQKSAKKRHKDARENKNAPNSSFSETFAKKSTERLDGDITDENYNSDAQRKRAIGGKLATAMETIEIVKYGEPDEPPADSDVTKRNSVEKCLVWMEVNGGVDEEPHMTSSRSMTLPPTISTKS